MGAVVDTTLVSRRTTVGARIVLLMTVAWLVAVAVLMWMIFGVGMESWADHHSNSGERAEELRREGARLSLWLAGVGAAGPALITVVAFATRLVKTGVVYLLLSMTLAIGAAYVAADAYRTLRPDPPPPSGPNHCVEHSGGDTRCPGG